MGAKTMIAREGVYPSLPTSPWRKLFRLALLFLAVPPVLILLSVNRRSAVPVPVNVKVIYADHAEKHSEAEQIRRCLEDNGASQVWHSRSWRTPYQFFRTCTLVDGRISVQIVRWARAAGVWKEVTSFVVKDGKADQMFEYLSAIAERV